LNLVCLEVVLTTVMCLVANRLPKFATTIHCEERFSVIKIFNCLFLNVYISPCVSSHLIRGVRELIFRPNSLPFQ